VGSRCGYQYCFTLSPGEGLVCCRLLPINSGSPHLRESALLIFFDVFDCLDCLQPTNHLDADTVRALCEALSTFEV
jgi:hypothetical protein